MMSEPDSQRPTPPLFAEGAQPAREPAFNLPGVVLALIALCVGIHVVRVYALNENQDIAVLLRAAFIPVRYSGRYALDVWAFTSPFTYALLHGSFLHLGVNMIWLAAFGSPLANRIGWLRFAVFFAVTGVVSAFLFFAVHPLSEAPLVGASGAISGMMGAAARFAFRVDRSGERAAFAGAPLPFGAVLRSRPAMTFLAVWMIVNLVTGVVAFVPGNDAQIAWEAHIGGFLAGFLGLRLFDRSAPYA